MKKNSVRYFSIESIVANEFISDQKKKKMKNQLVKKNSKKKKKISLIGSLSFSCLGNQIKFIFPN